MTLFNAQLIEKYNYSGPRYTSYPTANNFHDLSENVYKEQIKLSNLSNKPLSLYFHIPFCDSICYYCACNKVITKNRGKALLYLNHLIKEMTLQSQLLDSKRTVKQIHLGGGTPTFLSNDQLLKLSDQLYKTFTIDKHCENSIEIDPRGINKQTIKILSEAKFNRLSLGVQDFNHDVQKSINRIQTFNQTKQVIDDARKYDFKSINIDLMYGLPKQTIDTFKTTLNQIIPLKVDRISLFNYAHLPEIFKPQRRIHSEQLPPAKEKLTILKYTIDFLLDHDYVYIGMDHFALQGDPLSIAQRQYDLRRNFQGYSTGAQCDMIGLGCSAIGQFVDCFSQNSKDLESYYNALDNDKLPITKGLILSADDKIRSAVIMDLMCHFELNVAKVNTIFGIDFFNYFEKELDQLTPMINDGLLTIGPLTIKVMARGKMLIRNICMTFDTYFTQKNSQFSKII